VERIIYHGRDLTPLASVLAQLAFALDEHGSPIDYARRRALFTDLRSVTLDLDACTRLRLQHGWSAGYAPREAVLRWYLLVLLTGEHPAIPGTKKPFSWRCNNFRSGAPRLLRVFLRQQAEANLARHGITEPVTWEPPPHWVTWPDWPGTEPARFPTAGLVVMPLTCGFASRTCPRRWLAFRLFRLAGSRRRPGGRRCGPGCCQCCHCGQGCQNRDRQPPGWRDGDHVRAAAGGPRMARCPAGFMLVFRHGCVQHRLAYAERWQPRLPDPSFASPALAVVIEDKSGAALT
jgi:hypothetical protein